MKKIAALTLALCLLAGVFVLGTFAEEESAVPDMESVLAAAGEEAAAEAAAAEEAEKAAEEVPAQEFDLFAALSGLVEDLRAAWDPDGEKCAKLREALTALREKLTENLAAYYDAVREKLADPAWREAVRAEAEEQMAAFHAHAEEYRRQAEEYAAEHEDEWNAAAEEWNAAAEEWRTKAEAAAEEWKAAAEEWRAKAEAAAEEWRAAAEAAAERWNAAPEK